MDDYWDSLLNWGGGVLESVGEGIGDLVDGFVDETVAVERANNRDPDTISNAQVEQGTRTNGTAVNHETGSQGQGFVLNNTTLIIGGTVLFVILGAVIYVAGSK